MRNYLRSDQHIMLTSTSGEIPTQALQCVWNQGTKVLRYRWIILWAVSTRDFCRLWPLGGDLERDEGMEWGSSEQLALKLNSFNLRISAVNSGLHVSWKGVKWSHAHASMHVHNSPNIFQNTFSSFNSHLPGARCKFLIVMIKVANKTQ